MGVTGCCVEGGEGGDVDDGAAAVGEHGAEGGAATEEGGADVEGEEGFKVSEGEVGDVGVAGVAADEVEPAVDAVVEVEGGEGEGVGAGFVGEVGREDVEAG